MKKSLLFSLLSTLVLVPTSYAATLTSVYTDLNDKACKTLESDSEGSGWYKGQCKGVGGYQLILTEGDIRQSLDVVTPKGKTYPLDLIGKVSHAFSVVGDKAEWRVQKQGNKMTPIALIVRYNAAENSEDPSKNTSYLVVSKITKNAICVTDVVKPQADANTKARQLADRASTRACK